MTLSGSNYAKRIASLASGCLIDEARLTPKPGLVDSRGSGSHKDMTLALLEKSARTLEATFLEMATASWGQPVDMALRSKLGLIGRTGEKQMLLATGGINTHRGAIWALGLLVAACSVLKGKGSAQEVIGIAAAISRIADPALEGVSLQSHGLNVKERYKKPGAREEAQTGFPHITQKGLPTLIESRKRGLAFDLCAINALLSIMTTLSDTCVISRAGLEGLKKTQDGAANVLACGGMGCEKGEKAFLRLDATLRQINGSPGGAADLLAATFFVDRLNQVLP